MLILNKKKPKPKNKTGTKHKHKYKNKGGTPEAAAAWLAFSAGCFAFRYVLIKFADKYYGTCKVCKKVIRDEKGRSLVSGGIHSIKYEISTAPGCGYEDIGKEMPICPICWSKIVRERSDKWCKKLLPPPRPYFIDNKYKQKKITEYFKKKSNSPSRNSPSRNSPSRNSPSRNSPPKFLDKNRKNEIIREEINKNYPELSSTQKEKLYKTLLRTELLWKTGGKKIS